METEINLNKLDYRKGVLGVIVDDKNNFLITQLASYGDNQWRFAGGGLEENETDEQALLRELSEELGSSDFQVIQKSKVIIKYDWPMKVVERRLKEKGKTFKGQIQTQFLVKFTGSKENIKIDPKEIRKIKWVEYKELENYFNFEGQWKEAQETVRDLLPNTF